MNDILFNIFAPILGLALGLASALSLIKIATNPHALEQKKHKAKELIDNAEKQAIETISQTNQTINRDKESFEAELKRRKDHSEKVRESLNFREESLKKREDKLRQLSLQLKSENEFFESAQNAVKDLESKSLAKLTQIVGATKDEMKSEIINSLNNDLEKYYEDKILNIEESLRDDAGKIAKKIITEIMQRISSATSVESRVVNIIVPKDHIKGKIIGKGAVNILHLESKIDVDIIFNDEPNTITLSAFNLVNRYTAQKTIENLIKVNGDISPKTVDIAMEKAEKEVEKELFSLGRRAVQKMNLKVDNKELISIIGRLEFRTSYGQNIMKHSMEVAYIAMLLGAELGLNIETCKIGGFLHDLGKAIDQNPDIQGAHDFLTKELMEKYGFSKEEVHAAWTHHNSQAPETAEALIVMAADAISASRPGARQESIERYIEKIQALEETARSFEGVKNTYAISAGREIRLFVDPEMIKDEGLKNLADSVAKKIENNIAYPGTIKVKVFRKTHNTELAK
ncbi:MAG: Rnase Y domain-containing protein [Candidatus Gracilibacteria bacterium]|jgi:ribonuclease Y|nr:Rnase Y domain-containing protein [Candidatus Gracilibacteria bacterium]